MDQLDAIAVEPGEEGGISQEEVAQVLVSSQEPLQLVRSGKENYSE
jgi:hypothetical protein